MHERGLMKGIVETALAQAQRSGAARITALNLVMYEDGHTTTDSLMLHFQTLARGTLAEVAQLNIERREREWRCWKCGQIFASASADAFCPRCDSPGILLQHTETCYLESVEIE